jgi:superfamily II DNA or RNA helicase
VGFCVAVRNVEMYRDAFRGDLEPEVCDKVDTLLEYINEVVGTGGVVQEIPNLMNSIYALREEQIEQVLEQKNSVGVDKPLGSLRDGQTLDVAFTLLVKNALLGASVGLGKTAVTASLINIYRDRCKELGVPFRYVFVTANHLIHQSRKELVMFTGEYVGVTSGDQKEVARFIKEGEEIGGYEGIVATYSAVKSFEFMRWLHNYLGEDKLTYLFVDESEVLGNVRSDLYKNMKVLREYAENVVCLNATVFAKDITTMYAQLDFVAPDKMPNKTPFEQAYCVKHHITNQIIGYRNTDEFNKAIRYIYFKRSRQERGVSVVGSHVHLYLHKLSNYQRDLLGKTSMYYAVFEDPSIIDDEWTFNLEDVPKAMKLLELVRENRGEQFIVYVQNVQTQYNLRDMLEKAGFTVSILNGQDTNTAKKKAAVKDAFKQEKRDVLLTNLQTGLNMNEVNHLVFYSFSKDSGKMAQVEGRMVRELDIVGKNIYIIMANKKEYEVLTKARQHAIATAKHTKGEVSLLNKFLVEGLSDGLEVVLEELKDRSAFMGYFKYTMNEENAKIEV